MSSPRPNPNKSAAAQPSARQNQEEPSRRSRKNKVSQYPAPKDRFIRYKCPGDFLKERETTTFNLNDFIECFKKYCIDFLLPLTTTTTTTVRAVQFCYKVIYDIDIKNREMKTDHPKVWKINFPYERPNGTKLIKAVYVYGELNNENNYKQRATENEMVMSVKQANLLALLELELLNEMVCKQTPANYLLTPLAAVFFDRKDIPKLFDKLPLQSLTELINILNASAYSDGFHLKNSSSHVAAVYNIIATKNVKDPIMRDFCLGKSLRQYSDANKLFEKDLFEIYAEYAIGSVPVDINPDKLIELYDSNEAIFPRQAVRATKDTITINVASLMPTIQHAIQTIDVRLIAKPGGSSGTGEDSHGSTSAPSTSADRK